MSSMYDDRQLQIPLIIAMVILILGLSSCFKPASERIGKTIKKSDTLCQLVSRHAPFTTFYSRLRATVPTALEACQKNRTCADSIAIATLDSLSLLGDEFFDYYYLDSTLVKQHVTDSTAPAIDSILAHTGIATGMLDGKRMFKGDPRYIADKFNGYLSEAGKAFFEVRIQDQLQSALYDDGIIFLPPDTIGKRAYIWDEVSEKYKGTYAGKLAREFMRRYLVLYLPRDPTDESFRAEFGISSKDSTYIRFASTYGNSRLLRIIHEFANIYWQTKDSFIRVNDLPTLFVDTTTKDIYNGMLWFRDHRIGLEYDSVPRYYPSFVHSYLELSDFKDRWLSLNYSKKGKWNLIRMVPQIFPCYQEVEANGDQTDTTPNAVCVKYMNFYSCHLFRTKLFVPGPVTVAYKGLYPPMPALKCRIEFHFLGSLYQFISLNDGWLPNERIFLARNGCRLFLLCPLRDTDDESYISWCGDLDRDGRLDIIAVQNGTSIPYARLLLSKYASKERMVDLAAIMDNEE